MRGLGHIRLMSLWQVDPNNAGRDQDLYFRLKRYLLASAHYLDISHHEDLFLPHKMSLEKALNILLARLNMKASPLERSETPSSALPLIVRHDAELTLLLPQGLGQYRIFGAGTGEKTVQQGKFPSAMLR